MNRIESLTRVIRVNGNRAIMPETNGTTLLYEMGDVGYGALGWVCKGLLYESQSDYKEKVAEWMGKDEWSAGYERF